MCDRFADYRRDDKLIDFKNRLIDETLETQTEEGYIGMMHSDVRVVKDWDIHAAAHLIIALTYDYRVFGNKRSLDAAVQLCDYTAKTWSKVLGRPATEQPGGGVMNQTMAMCTSQLRLNQLHPDARLLKPSQQVKRFLINGDGAAIIGAIGWMTGRLTPGKTASGRKFVKGSCIATRRLWRGRHH